MKFLICAGSTLGCTRIRNVLLYTCIFVSCLGALNSMSRSLQQGSILTMDYSPEGAARPKDSGLVASDGGLRFLWAQLVKQTRKGSTNHMILSNLISRRAPNDNPSEHKNMPLYPEEIVLVTHGSIFKLDIFLTQLDYWRGPVSLALHINEGDEQIEILETFIDQHHDQMQNVSVHLYMEYTNLASTESTPPPYPHNILRNLAMDECESDFFVAIDIDFIPGPLDCYTSLQKTLNANNRMIARAMKTLKMIYVLPAFELLAPTGEKSAVPAQLPSSKQQLRRQVDANLTEPFHHKRYADGHGPSNFEKWYTYDDSRSSKTNYGIDYRPGFEPYTLAYRPGIPRYWDGFRGYGFNKQSWIMELHRAGYGMNVLTQQYVIHLEHPSTLDTLQRRKNFKEYNDFISYIDVMYPIEKNRQKLNTNFFHNFPKRSIDNGNSTTVDKAE